MHFPALPIPQFSTPAEFSSFGIPEGTLLGLTNGMLSNTVRSWLAEGTLGEMEPRNAEPAGEMGGVCLETCRWSRDGQCDDAGPVLHSASANMVRTAMTWPSPAPIVDPKQYKAS